MKNIAVIHLTIIFLLLLVIYGSAQEQQIEDTPTQSFFFLSHSVFISPDEVKIDGENGTIIATGDLSYPRSNILDIAEINGTKAVLFSHGIYGSVGYTKIRTETLSTKQLPLGQSFLIGNTTVTYIGIANGTLGQYHVYNINGQNITVDNPTTINIDGKPFLLSVKQNTLEVDEMENTDEIIDRSLIVEAILGILAVGLIMWTKKSGYGLFSS